MNEFKTGQDVIKESQQSGSSIGGFNLRVHGHTYTDAFRYPHERTDADRHGGWDLADRMIADGALYYVHNFHRSHGDCPSGFAFPYGATWVCNTCNSERLDKDWWKIKVFKDGNAWCCVGLGFEDLQSSDNYAFGDTREEAIQNYGDVVTKLIDTEDTPND